jgi:DNA-binding transcriptional MerR regulator
MTIGEIEARSGMTRANIRFYESKGLITPSRFSNDYRDYSVADLSSLLKIKLLHQLQVPVDEIRKLQTGELELGDALSEKLAQLESDVAQRITAAEICRDISAAGVKYDELDAPKYLSRIAGASLAIPSFFAVRGDELPHAPHPWRRYFARTLDLFIYSAIWIAVCALIFRVNPGSRDFNQLLNFLVPHGLTFIAEPILLSTLGATPGKWIFGLFVRNAAGGKLTFWQAWDRL